MHMYRINPISETGNKDKKNPSEPVGYHFDLRCIQTVLLCQFNHISHWAESDTITADEQNGFRKKTGPHCHLKRKYRLKED